MSSTWHPTAHRRSGSSVRFRRSVGQTSGPTSPRPALAGSAQSAGLFIGGWSISEIYRRLGVNAMKSNHLWRVVATSTILFLAGWSIVAQQHSVALPMVASAQVALYPPV